MRLTRLYYETFPRKFGTYWEKIKNKSNFDDDIKNKAIDRNGNYLPWFSYPIIEILINHDLNKKKILEFGAGCSTFFF